MYDNYLGGYGGMRTDGIYKPQDPNKEWVGLESAQKVLGYDEFWEKHVAASFQTLNPLSSDQIDTMWKKHKAELDKKAKENKPTPNTPQL